MIGLWVVAFSDLRLLLQISSGPGWTAYRLVVASPFLGTLLEGEWLSVPHE